MQLDQAIKERKTIKILADEAQPIRLSQEDQASLIHELIDLAGYAPFHYPTDPSHLQGQALNSEAPWRFYSLDTAACRNLATWMTSKSIPGGKITQICQAADALIFVTWLPDPTDSTDVDWQPNQRNMEHIAAASAAAQNLLLGATARGLNNYWSSGGVLRQEFCFDLCGIPKDQIMLGALFIYPPGIPDCNFKMGAMRQRKGGVETWSRKIHIPS